MAQRTNRPERRPNYKFIAKPEIIAKICPENKSLMDEFRNYLVASGYADGSVLQYCNNVKIFMCWNVEFNENKPFLEIQKADFARYQKHGIQEWNWAPHRVNTAVSSVCVLGNFVSQYVDSKYKNPARSIPNVHGLEIRKRSFFTKQDFDVLLKKLVADGKIGHACLLALAISSGLRANELPQLKVKWFTKKNLLNTDAGQVYRTPEEIQIRGVNKEKRMCHVHILKAPMQKYLNLWIKYRKEHGYQSEYLFPSAGTREMKTGSKKMSQYDVKNWGLDIDRYSGDKAFYWTACRSYFQESIKKSGLPESLVQLLSENIQQRDFFFEEDKPVEKKELTEEQAIKKNLKQLDSIIQKPKQKKRKKKRK